MNKPPHVNAVSKAIAWAARVLRDADKRGARTTATKHVRVLADIAAGTPPFHGKGPLTRDEIRALESFNAEVTRSWVRYLNGEEPK